MELGKKLFIVIVEDDADDRFLFQTAFDENGFKDDLLYIENGYELMLYLNKLKNTPRAEKFPDFILLDLNMPKKDGREVLEEIKKDDIFNKIPVIIFSTTNNDNEQKRCLEAGATGYYAKPVTFESLIKIVAQIRNSQDNTLSF